MQLARQLATPRPLASNQSLVTRPCGRARVPAARQVVVRAQHQDHEAQPHRLLDAARGAALGLAAAALVLLPGALPARADLPVVAPGQLTQMAKPLPKAKVDKGKIWIVFVGGAAALFIATVAVENNEAWFPAIARANKAMRMQKKSAPEPDVQDVEAREVQAREAREVQRQTAMVEQALQEAKLAAAASASKPSIKTLLSTSGAAGAGVATVGSSSSSSNGSSQGSSTGSSSGPEATVASSSSSSSSPHAGLSEAGDAVPAAGAAAAQEAHEAQAAALATAEKQARMASLAGTLEKARNGGTE